MQPESSADVSAWTPHEENIIAAIGETEGVDRLEAIRRMQRRRYGFPPRREGSDARLRAWFARNQPENFRRLFGTPRFCGNANCRRGDGGKPASIDHLAGKARFCSDACKMAFHRSPNPQKSA